MFVQKKCDCHLKFAQIFDKTCVQRWRRRWGKKIFYHSSFDGKKIVFPSNRVESVDFKVFIFYILLPLESVDFKSFWLLKVLVSRLLNKRKLVSQVKVLVPKHFHKRQANTITDFCIFYRKVSSWPETISLVFIEYCTLFHLHILTNYLITTDYL